LITRGCGRSACGRPGMCLLEVGQRATARLGTTILGCGDHLPIGLLAPIAQPINPAKAVSYPGASGLERYIAARAALERLVRLALVKPGAAVGTVEVPRNDAPDRGCRGSRQQRIRPAVADGGGRSPPAGAPRRLCAAERLARLRSQTPPVRRLRAARRRPCVWVSQATSDPRRRRPSVLLSAVRSSSSTAPSDPGSSGSARAAAITR
jgi:hypothetical protein